MQTLGVSGPPAKDDNIFQRLFWPSDNPGETDLLGQQGFWICFVVGLGSCIFLFFQGDWISGVVTALFFVLGGIGVREHSVVAASLVAPAYLLNLVAAALTGRFPGFLAIVASVLLIANIRGTWIASRWKDKGDPEELPLRFSETWRDKLVDQMPAIVWPKTRILFYVVAALYMTLLAVGAAVVLAKSPVGQHLR